MIERRLDTGDWPAAVADLEGPQLILAGPGTGKTEFLARRAAHVLEQPAAGGVLLLTFSRRAASELLGRVEQLLGRSTVQVPASTFHSFAYRLLEKLAAERGVEMPTLLTGPEQVALVGELLRSDDPSRWPLLLRRSLSTQTLAGELADFILKSREHLLTVHDIADEARQRDDWRAIPGFLDRYDEALAARQRLDYGTLIARACQALGSGAVADSVSEQFAHVLVDEFQDTTPAQVRMVEELSRSGSQVTAAADPHQAIYGFRGAEPENVARFGDRFSTTDRPAKTVILNRSFRVPAEILVAARRLGAASGLEGLVAEPVPSESTGRVEVVVFDQHTHEADWIASELQHEHFAQGIPYRSMAVLVRTKRRLLRELDRALQRRDIPHDEPESRLSAHPATGLLLDSVLLATNRSDHGPEFELANRAASRLLLGPLIRATVSEERSLLRHRLRTRATWGELLAGSFGRPGLAGLASAGSWATEIPARDGFWTWWTSLPELEQLVADPLLGSYRAAWASLAQVLSRLYERDPGLTLADYGKRVDDDTFEAIPLLSYTETGADRVTLTTMHQAKGLEFDIVIIADAVEGVLPDLRRRRSILQVERLGGAHPEDRIREEARLAYTAMCRAKRRVVWTATQAGVEEGQMRPSRFIAAITERGAENDLAPGAAERAPVTFLEAEAYLRSRVVDPTIAASVRLAAAAVLAKPPRDGVRAVSEYPLVRTRGPDSGLMPYDLRLSPSQAQSYERCPRRYVLNRRLRIGDAPNPYSLFGTMIHQVLEKVEGEAMAAGQERSTLDAALTTLFELLPAHDFGSSVSSEAWGERGEKLLTRLYQGWPRPGARPVAIERYLEMELDDVAWRGYADRIEEIEPGSLRVVDYKTSKTVPTEDEVSDSLQLGFYALAVGSDPGLQALGRVTAAESWHPLSPKKPRVRTFSMGRVGTVTERLIDIGRRIASENWQPVVGPDCDRCPVRILCDEWPEGRPAFVR